MSARLLKLALVATALLSLPARSAGVDVTVEGGAPIRNGDLGQARELATRRALARAAESQSLSVSSQTLLRDGVMTESAQVDAAACTENAQILDETVNADELILRMQVTVREPGTCRQTCRQTTRNRVVVAGFAVAHPEQIRPNERSWLTHLTSAELARWIDKRQRLLTAHDALAFPHASPDRAPRPHLLPEDVETPFSLLARRHRSQYVLAGVYRDLSLADRMFFGQTRRIEIEAFIHDGVNGSVLERKTFTAMVSGQVLMTPRPAVGTAEFYASDLGRAWGGLMRDMADWATEKIACLPLVARVLKTEDSHIYLDAGADSGLSVGDTLVLHTWRRPPGPVRAEGQMLGQEKFSRATASIKYRYPEFSVAELVDAKGIDLAPGDLFYAK